MNAIERLYSERPMFHGSGTQSFHVPAAVANWLSDHIGPSSVTLETGTGYSTVVFAAEGSYHLAISPDQSEHSAIARWCEEHDVATERIGFRCVTSESWLPSAELSGLDLVLIDGDHAFPIPLLDWFYTAEALKVGGYVVIDDVQLPAPAVLQNFLMGEVQMDRWRYVGQLVARRTSVFQKVHAHWKHPWTQQGWSCRGGAKHE